MNKDRQLRIILITILLLITGAISVAFAILSQNLDISTTGKVKGNNWSIIFDNLVPFPHGTAEDDNSLIVGGTTANISAVFKKPGDKVIYNFDVVNNGTLNAVLYEISIDGDFDIYPDIKMSFSYNNDADYGNKLPESKDTLAAGQSRPLIMTIEFDKDAVYIPNEDKIIRYMINMIYVQEDFPEGGSVSPTPEFDAINPLIADLMKVEHFVASKEAINNSTTYMEPFLNNISPSFLQLDYSKEIARLEPLANNNYVGTALTSETAVTITGNAFWKEWYLLTAEELALEGVITTYGPFIVKYSTGAVQSIPGGIVEGEQIHTLNYDSTVNVPVITISPLPYNGYLKSDQLITITAESSTTGVTLEWEGRNEGPSYYVNGFHEIKVKALNADDIASPNATIVFSVRDNTPPETPIITVSPPDVTAFKKGRIVTITALANDIDGDELIYEWENRPAESHAYEVGYHTVRVRAKDTSGAFSSWASFSFTVKNEDAVQMSMGAQAAASGYSANFDVWGMDGSTKVLTTYGNQGYASYLKIGTDAPTSANSPMINAWPKTTDGVTVTRTQGVDDVLNFIVINWTVTNTNAVPKTFSLACYADVKILNDDDAPLTKTNTGLLMTSKNGKYSFSLYLKNMAGVTNVDTIYFEKYSKAPSSYVPKYTEVAANSFSGSDSVMEFAWVNRTIEAFESKTYTIYIGIE